MLGDPLAVYRLPRASQVELLGLLEADTSPAPVELDADGDPEDLARWMRTGRRTDPAPGGDGPRQYGNPDPEQGARLPRDPGVQAVNSDARRRHDRFRVA